MIEGSETSAPLQKFDISRNPKLATGGATRLLTAIADAEVQSIRLDLGAGAHTLERAKPDILLASTDGLSLRTCDLALLAKWVNCVKASVSSIVLDGNNSLVLDEDCAPIWASFCTSCHETRQLKRLSLSSVGIEMQLVPALAELISSATVRDSLVVLDLSSNLACTESGEQSEVAPPALNAATGLPAWTSLCEAIAKSQVTDLNLSNCFSWKGWPLAATKILANTLLAMPSLSTLDISGSGLFVSSGETEDLDDHLGWMEICAQLRKESCHLTSLRATRIGLMSTRLHYLYDQPNDKNLAFPLKLTQLNLSSNPFARDIPFGIKKGKTADEIMLNLARGGRDGITGRTKVTTGACVVLRDPKNLATDQVFKVIEREEMAQNYNKDKADQLIECLDVVTNERKSINIVDILRDYEVFDPKHVNIGSYTHTERMWASLCGSNITALDVSNSSMDTTSVRELADAVRSMDHVKKIRISSTGDGPWRGANGVQVRPPFVTSSNGVDHSLPGSMPIYELALDEAGAISVADMCLGPEDALLVAAWLTRPAIQGEWMTLDMSHNPIFGNSDGAEDALAVQVEGDGVLGSHRIMQANLQWQTPQVGSPNDARAGQVVYVDQVRKAAGKVAQLDPVARERRCRDCQDNWVSQPL
jgi:hypothetical protein